MSRKTKMAESHPPTLDFGPASPEGIRLTNDVRAEMIARTGQDIAPDDPLMVVVYLNQILLGHIADEIAAKLAKANAGAAEALQEMRQEVLNSVAAELGSVDFSQAEARASARLQGQVSMSKGFWFAMGVVATALFVLGILVGRMI